MQKLLGTTALQTLNQKTVSILALGSLGSQIALALAQAGVGNFILVDPDVLEEHNIVRHAADHRYVDSLKVSAVAELIRYRNPLAVVKTVAQDALTSVEEWIDADLVIVAGFGSEIAQQQVNQILIEHSKPAIYGGAYERAEAGEVLYVDCDESTPCYACFSSYLRDEEATKTPVNQEFEYGMMPDEVKAEPGLGMHVHRIALAAADWAMRVLVDDETVLPFHQGNLVILSNERYVYGSDEQGNDLVLPPFSSYWTTIPKVPGCLICDLPDAGESEMSIDELLNL